MNWNGNLSASISQNAFLVNGGSNTGVLVNNGSSTGVTTISYTNNVFTSEGGSDTALHVVIGGRCPVERLVERNSVRRDRRHRLPVLGRTPPPTST